MRKPRPVELQLKRINRYLQLIRERDGVWRDAQDTFIELTDGRGILSWDDVPELSRLVQSLDQGLYTTVYVDIQEGQGFSANNFRPLLNTLESRAKVVNVFYDLEPLDWKIESVLGVESKKAWFFTDDDSDFLTYFPGLAAAIITEFVNVYDLAVSDNFYHHLSHLGKENVYAGRGPLFGQRMKLERAKAHERLLEDRKARRQTETCYVVGKGPPELLDECFGLPRSDESLEWAKSRLTNVLGFTECASENTIAFTRQFGDVVVYADPRETGRITFSGFRSGRGRRDFHSPLTIPDAWKNRLPEKLEEWVAKFSNSQLKK
ncbi:MAG: hypothetical protein WC314_09025 [Vulcanimicrobiota bacterium]